MKHIAVDSFWNEYNQLPLKIRKCVDNNFETIKQYPKHPLLRLMNVEDIWSMRIDSRFRAFAIEENGAMIWFWVGNYVNYKQQFSLI